MSGHTKLFYGRRAIRFSCCQQPDARFELEGLTIPGSGLDVQHREIGQPPAADARAGWAAGIGSTCRQGSDTEKICQLS